MYCKQCGTENGENMSFCKECGAPLKKYEIPHIKDTQTTSQTSASNTSSGSHNFGNNASKNTNSGFYDFENNTPGYVKTNNFINDFGSGASTTSTIPSEYKPISMWGYFGYEVLFSIPFIGFIALLIFSFGGTQNQNLKNFARSYFCFLILAIIFVFFILGGSGIAMMRY